MKFSSRERFLIGTLLVIIIWFVALKGFIWPGYEGYGQSQKLLENQEEESGRIEFYLSHYDELQSQWEKRRTLGSGEDFFFRNIDDTFMDQNLQNLAEKAGVSIHRMNIEKTSFSEIAYSEEAEEGEDPMESDTSAGSVMETVITMEVHCPDAESVMIFAEEIRKEQKSLLVTYLDMAPVYEGGDDGQEVYREMSGIMEVRYYYEEIR